MRPLFVYGSLRRSLLPPEYRPPIARGQAVSTPAHSSTTASQTADLVPNLAVWNEEEFPDLLRGICARLQFAGTGRVRGRLYDLGRYPGAVFDPNAESEIVGDVYLLPPDPAVLASLDAYEGYDPRYPEQSLFRRVPVSVRLEDGSSLDCWMYVYNRDLTRAHLIPEGDYVAYRRWNTPAS